MRRTSFAALIALLLLPRLASPQGEPLGPEFRVNTYTAGDQAYSSVAARGADFVIVWESQVIDGSFGISGQRYDSAGNALGTEFRVNSYTTGAQRVPAVGANAAGDFVVVWESYGQDGSKWGVFGQRYAPSGAPVGPEFRVNTTTADYQLDPAVAVAPSGAFLVTWYSALGAAPPEPPDVFAQRYDSTGVPQGPEFRVNAYTPGSQADASVATDPAGNFVVVWTGSPDGSLSGVFGQRYNSSGAPLGPEFRVNTYTSHIQIEPAVATDPAGDFVVAWSSKGQEGEYAFGVFGQRYAAGGRPLGPEFRVNTYTTGNQRQPAIATDAAGNFVIVWTDDGQDGSALGVFGQRYTSDGVPSGLEFRVNTTTSFSQRAPSVASDPAGIFVVTWHGNGRAIDVFGQRFGGIFPVELQDFRLK